MSQTDNEAAGGLPFDVPTLVKASLARWPFLVLLLGLAGGAGYMAAQRFGEKSYESESVLLYQPELGCPSSLCPGLPPTLASLAELVKVQSVLHPVREELALEMSLQDLGAAINVTTHKSGTLLILKVRGPTPEEAQTICSAVRDAFLTEQARRLRDTKAVGLDEKLAELHQERSAIESKLQGLVERAAELQEEAETERAKSAGDDPEQARVKRQLILESIADDERRRVNAIELSRAQTEYERAKTMAEQELIPATEVERARTAYERAKALSEDPPQVKKWKAELKRLEEAVTAGGSGMSSSEQLLLLVLNRAMELEMRRFELNELEAEWNARKEALTEEINPSSSAETGFSEVSAPQAPNIAISSTRKTLAIGVAAALSLFGAALLLAPVLLYRRFRSPAELAMFQGSAPLVSIPKQKKRDVGHKPADTYLLLANQLRKRLKEHEAQRILVMSANAAEGRSTTAKALVDALLRSGVEASLVECEGTELPTELQGKRKKTKKESVTVVDGPAILCSAALELLAPSVDAALMIVRAQRCAKDELARARQRLEATGLPLLGSVFNAASKRYLRRRDVADGTL
ncbi:MAG: hypothetical protein RBU37_27290 [Myxococcota bacterium]|jgi:Mrp family chromosome partitioning ATPase|nr:hypothetical protein [Myxococcota bacterium]